MSHTELLPARMLNEFVYCPGLFYYGHVQGAFLPSRDPKRGGAEPIAGNSIDISALLGARPH